MQHHQRRSGRIGALSYRGVTYSTNNNSLLTLLATIADNDIGIYIDIAFNTSGTPSKVIPIGYNSVSFTEIASWTYTMSGGYYTRVTSSYKILTAGDASISTTGQTGQSSGSKRTCAVFTPTKKIQSCVASSIANQYTTGNPTAQTVSSSTANIPLVIIAFQDTYDGVVSWVNALDADYNADTYDKAAYKIINASPANFTVDVGDSGSGTFLGSFCLSVG